MSALADERWRVAEKIGKDRSAVDRDLRNAGEEGLDAPTLDRWLVGNDGNAEKASENLKKHARWTRSRKHHIVGREDVQKELQGTSVSLQGCDAWGQPLIVIRLGQLEAQQRQRHSADSSNVQGILVAAVDAAVKSMDRTVNKAGKMSVLVDLHAASHRSLDRVLLQEVFKVLREHYPERLCEVWIWDAPLFFSAMWQAVSQFINPGTREKVRFARGKNGQRNLVGRFGSSILPRQYGGRADLVPVSQALHRVQINASVPSGPALRQAPNVPSQKAHHGFGSEPRSSPSSVSANSNISAISNTSASSNISADGNAQQHPSPAAAEGASPPSHSQAGSGRSVPRGPGIDAADGGTPADSLQRAARDVRDQSPPRQGAHMPAGQYALQSGNASSTTGPPSPLKARENGDGGRSDAPNGLGGPRAGIVGRSQGASVVGGDVGAPHVGHVGHGQGRSVSGGRPLGPVSSAGREPRLEGDREGDVTSGSADAQGTREDEDDVNLTIKRGRRFPPKVPSGPIFGAAAVVRVPLKTGASTARCCCCFLCPRTRS